MGGFTLVELILVMAIIAILSVVGIGSYTQATVKSRDTERKSDLNQMAKALESFMNDVGRYPLDDDGGNMTCPYYDPVNEDMSELLCDNSLTASVGDSNKVEANRTYADAVYMSELPSDPSSGRRYYYEQTTSGFSLYMALENSEDRDVVVDEEGVATNWEVNCGTTTTPVMCNYKLTETGLIKTKTD